MLFSDYRKSKKVDQMADQINRVSGVVSCTMQPRVPAALARKARERGEQIAMAICAWVRRWGYASDKALAALYPGRPKLGYDLWRRGLLTRYEVPAGVRFLDGRYAYGISSEGALIAEDALPPQLLDIEHSAKPAWSTMQHLMDLQRYCIALGMLPADRQWFTEPELRARPTSSLVPDAMFRESHDKIWWIECERSPKNDVPLDYWSQQIARDQAARLNQRSPESRAYVEAAHEREPLISRLIVIVPTEYQQQRYSRAFHRDYAEVLARDPKTRQIRRLQQKANLPIGAILNGVSIEIQSPNDFWLVEGYRKAEAQREAVLKSRYWPGN